MWAWAWRGCSQCRPCRQGQASSHLLSRGTGSRGKDQGARTGQARAIRSRRSSPPGCDCCLQQQPQRVHMKEARSELGSGQQRVSLLGFLCAIFAHLSRSLRCRRVARCCSHASSPSSGAPTCSKSSVTLSHLWFVYATLTIPSISCLSCSSGSPTARARAIVGGASGAVQPQGTTAATAATGQ